MPLLANTAVIYAQDPIIVTAAVPAQASDYQLAFESLTQGTQFSQDSVITYQITYGSYLTYNSAITLQAQWGLGTIAGNATPTVEVLNYVVGSAGQANGASPVVDTVNRTITWTIPAFSPQTDKIVSFSLRTTSAYTGSEFVDFSVAARLMGPGVVLPDETVAQSYKYRSSTSSSGSSSTSSSTATPSPSFTATPIPTSRPLTKPVTFSDITITGITQSQTTFTVTTNTPTGLTFAYGLTPQLLNQSTTSSSVTTQHELTVDNLTPNTQYYGRFTAKDAKGNRAISEIITFKTAQISEIPVVAAHSVIVESYSTVFRSTDNQMGTAIIPKNFPYTVKFALQNPQPIKQVKLFITKNNQILEEQGVSTAGGNTFTASFVAPQNLDSFTIEAEIADFKGNITRVPVILLKVVSPLSVYDTAGKPVEKAYILLSRYNEHLKVYQRLGGKTVTSLANGIVPVVLTPGTYKVETKALQYNSHSQEFTVNAPSSGIYPTIILEKAPFSFTGFIDYHSNTIKDLAQEIYIYVYGIVNSTRYFNLMQLYIMALLPLAALLAFTLKTHISIVALPSYIAYLIAQQVNPALNNQFITGYITDLDTEKPLPSVTLLLINTGTNSVLAKTKTNAFGHFVLPKSTESAYKLAIYKKRFDTQPFLEYSQAAFLMGPLHIAMKRNTTEHKSVYEAVAFTLSSAVGSLFETLLLFSLLFEFLFAKNFGVVQTTPYIAITCFTLMIWLLYLNHQRQHTRYQTAYQH